MELGKPLGSVMRAEREIDVICPICYKVLHLMPGDVIPLCCGKRMEPMES